MGFFRKASSKSYTDDPDFGRIAEDRAGSWKGNTFELWGYQSIQLMIRTGREGATAEQRSFVRSLRADAGIRARIEDAIVSVARKSKTSPKMGALRLTSVFVPQSPFGETWRVWYDMEGEEQYWYGAEIIAGNRIVPFAED
jgi:hypothetical protein